MRDGRNSVNELTQRTIGQDPAIDLTYDDAGNLIQGGDSDGDHKYAWDYRNRLIEVQEKQSGNWTTIATYTYDAKNRRVVKEVTNKGELNGATRFVWGGESEWQCLEERDGSGDLVARFVYSPGYIDAVARQERDLTEDGDFGDTNEVVWYHSNTLYSIYALSDGSESVIERYRYDAYGGCTVLDADGSDDSDGLSDVCNPYTFTGRRGDLESALMQYRNRYYDVTLGRFLARDPLGRLGDPTSLHMGGYVYSRNRPGAAIDPSGKASLMKDHKAKVGSVLNKTFYLPGPCCNYGVVQIALQIRWRGPDDTYLFDDWHPDIEHSSLPPLYRDITNRCDEDTIRHRSIVPEIKHYDAPGMDETDKGQTGLLQKYETCLVCMDCGATGGYASARFPIMGCFGWGHVFQQHTVTDINGGEVWNEIRWIEGLTPEVTTKGFRDAEGRWRQKVILQVTQGSVTLRKPTREFLETVAGDINSLYERRCES